MVILLKIVVIIMVIIIEGSAGCGILGILKSASFFNKEINVSLL